MESIRFNGYKISSDLPLNKIASFFNIHSLLSWKDYIVLEGHNIDSILKYKAVSKHVYLFKFGCVIFINFDEDDINIFLDYLESIVDKVDHTLITKFYENHVIEVYDNGMCRLFKSSESLQQYNNDIIYAVSVVLAKSLELYKIELDLTVLLDEAENYIENLQKGRLHTNARKFAKTASQIMRFEHSLLSSIRIFDRPTFSKYSTHLIEAFDELFNYYELHDRLETIQSKINDLRNIIKSYSTLSYKQIGARLLWLEIFLLALFPLSHLAHFLLSFL